MEVKQALVIGSGTMGAGVGQLFAQQGIQVTITDINLDLATAARSRIDKGLAKRVAKEKISEDERQSIMSRISAAGDLAAAAEADFIMESASENIEIKKKIFAELDEKARPEVIIATNTTALSISEMASATKRPDKVLGMHFFNPPVIMKLVEIMPGMATSQETLDAAEALAKQLGKDPVVCKTESPAGIVSRTLGGLLNEATYVFQSGVASAEDIDKAMTLGANHKMGPLTLIDLIGLDIHLAKMETLYRELGDERYKPPYILRKMVRAGRLGRKVKKGFYDYE